MSYLAHDCDEVCFAIWFHGSWRDIDREFRILSKIVDVSKAEIDIGSISGVVFSSGLWTAL